MRLILIAMTRYDALANSAMVENRATPDETGKLLKDERQRYQPRPS